MDSEIYICNNIAFVIIKQTYNLKYRYTVTDHQCPKNIFRDSHEKLNIHNSESASNKIWSNKSLKSHFRIITNIV